MAHTQGKRHQTNLAKRAAREAKDAPAQPQPNKRKVDIRKTGLFLFIFSFLMFFCCCFQLRTSSGEFRY